MTGPERQDLGMVLRILERLEGKVDGIDLRVRSIELADATQVGVAAGSAAVAAHNAARAEKRSLSATRLFAIVASAAAAGASVAVILHTLGVI